MHVWRNLKIGVRLAAGIGSILVLLAVVAGSAYFGLSGGNTDFGKYRVMARQSVAAAAMNGELLAARLNVKEFLLKGTDKSVEDVTAAIDGLEGGIKNNTSLFEGSDADRQALAGIASSAQAYHAAFAKVVELRKQRDALVATMNEVGPKIEKNLSTVMDSAHLDADTNVAFAVGQSIRSLLLGRLYVNKFLNENS